MAVTVVADIGGTSSRWGVLGAGADERIIEGLPGFNPAVGAPDGFVRAVSERFTTEGLVVDELFAYGAGCGTPERAARMQDALLSVWPNTRVEVHSDLLGAAHGLLGDRSGLVLILGTGMNAGWSDGTKLLLPMPSLGYILGDEGSGADIGKHLLRAALHGQVPRDLMERIFPDGLSATEVVERLYRGDSPQAWLASFAGTLARAIDHPWARAFVLSRFGLLAELLTVHFPEGQRADIVATGSVAHGMSDLLRSVLGERGMRLSEVQPSPLPGLLRYRSAFAR